MPFAFTYLWFNLLEGVFWILLGCVAWYVRGRLRGTVYMPLAQIAALALVLFGISDFVEIKTDGFIGHTTWLLVWKALCVVGLFALFAWYALLRIQAGKRFSRGFIPLMVVLVCVLTVVVLPVLFPSLGSIYLQLFGAF